MSRQEEVPMALESTSGLFFLIIKTDILYTCQIDCRGGCADAVDDVRGALHLGDQQRLQQSKHRPCKLWQ